MENWSLPDYKEIWASKNWRFELWCWRTLESSLDYQEIKSVNLKGNQSWILLEALMVKLKPIFWPPGVKNWLIGKDTDAGKDWRQEEKGRTEDEMAGWHHWLNGHELEQALGVGDGQGSLVFCSPWGCKELDKIMGLNWTDTKSKTDRIMEN